MDAATAYSRPLVGQWWLPQFPDNPAYGSLTCSPTRLTLILSGPLEGLAGDGVWNPDIERPPLIYGRTDSGDLITLLEVAVAGAASTLGQPSFRPRCTANYALLGCHSPDTTELRLGAMQFHATHLARFVNDPCFDVQQSHDGGFFKNVSITFKSPDVRHYRIDSQSLLLSVEWELEQIYGHTQNTLKAEPVIYMTPDSPQSLDWHVAKTWRLCYLLTLLTDERIEPRNLVVGIDGLDGSFDLLWRRIEDADDDSDNVVPPLFQLTSVDSAFAQICNSWFSASELLVSAIHLFMDARAAKSRRPEGRFIQVTQALEAFSRATAESLYMQPDAYEAVREHLVSAIPVIVDRDHRNSLKKRIEFGNEFSFRKRVNDLLKSLEAETVQCVCVSPSDFVEGFIQTRNFYTHLTDELRSEALKGKELFWACEKAVMLLRVLLLRHIGIDEGTIRTHLRNHFRLKQYMWLYKDVAERIP